MTDIVERLRDASAIPGGLYSEAAEEIESLRQQLETYQKDASLLGGLQSLCGTTMDGSSETVQIYQDDDTHEWVLRIGRATPHRFYAESFHGVIAKALKGLNPSTVPEPPHPYTAEELERDNPYNQWMQEG